MTLVCFKPVFHWLFGLAAIPIFVIGVFMRQPQVLYLVARMAVLALFCTCIVSWRPQGPQISTFGHLQTLVDLIDEWPNKGDRVYWGHKGYVHGMGHACTSRKRLYNVA